MKTITKFDLSILIVTIFILSLIDFLYLKNQNFYYRIETFLGGLITTQFLYWIWPNIRLLIKQILNHPRKGNKKIKGSDESRKPLLLQVWNYSKKKKK